MGEGGQIWLKCITGDLIMIKRDKNNIFERVENIHADLAWNYPVGDYKYDHYKSVLQDNFERGEQRRRDKEAAKRKSLNNKTFFLAKIIMS